MIDPADLQAKSDQMNAVDFVQPITFRIAKVVYKPKTEQPAHLHMEGYDGRPYKPSKGMLRGLTIAWGKDEQQWAGRLITLFCEPSVRWAGKESGGIRISAISGIKEPLQFALTLNRSQRILYTFDVIADDTAVKKEFVLTHWVDDIGNAKTNGELDAIVSTVKAQFGADGLSQIRQPVIDARAALDAGPGDEAAEVVEVERDADGAPVTPEDIPFE